MSDIDPNKLIVELVKNFSQPVFDGAKSIGKDAFGKLQVNLDTCFTRYLERSYSRYSKTKTLLYREVPVNIKEFYVRTDLVVGNKTTIKESDFISESENNQRLVVTGTAGLGKSTFCKSIFLDLIENPRGIIPIFVELRHMNAKKEGKLYDYVHETLSKIEPTFSKQQLEYSLKLGKVMLIFDGFDEINNEVRDKYEEEIINMAGKYHNIMILVSSRPDNRFSSWEEFFNYRILPLDKEKALSLINKLDYDRQVKRQFITALEDKLFEQHKSFSSNPLLLTMMLLTYEQIAEIPTKVHLFYEQAFLTLFNKHDSLKSLYKRKSFSGLPLDDFKKVLSSFCILSYSDRKYYFTEKEIESYLKKAITICGIKTDHQHFMNDLLDSVCIMQRDGLGYTFSHRSFQEYFTALFLVGMANQNRYDIFDKIAFINDRDDVIPMIFDINPDLLEQEWIIPRLEKLVLDFSIIPNTNEGRLVSLSKWYPALVRNDWGEDNEKHSIAFRFGQQKDSHPHFFWILHKLYPEQMDNFTNRRIKKVTKEQKENESELVRLDMQEGAELNIEDITILKKATKLRIIRSGVCNHVINRLDFAKLKLVELRARHKKNKMTFQSYCLGVSHNKPDNDRLQLNLSTS